MSPTHRLANLLNDAAGGRFPPADGTVLVVRSPPGPSDAVVAFSAFNVVAATVDPEEVLARLPEGGDPGAPMAPAFLAWLGERLGSPPGMIDQVVVAPSPPASEDLPTLVRREDLDQHPRLARSRRYRTDVTAYSDPEDRAIVVLGRGLACRWEVAIEIEPEHRASRLGRSLARAAARLIPDPEPLFAQVTPGNIASVRAFLAAGYQPICSEVLFLRPR